MGGRGGALRGLADLAVLSCGDTPAGEGDLDS